MVTFLFNFLFDKILENSYLSAINELEVGPMINFIKTLIADEAGATAVEYGLIAAFIAIAAITAMMALNISLTSMFTAVSDQIDGAVQASGGTS
jgi:pilus assembly protein Flp/PilA